MSRGVIASLHNHAGQRDEFGIVAEGVEIGLVGDHVPVIGVDFQGTRQVPQRHRAIARQAPIAGQVVVQHGLARIDFHSPFQRFNRLRKLAGALVAPAKGEPDVNIVGHQVGAALERQEGFFVAVQLAQRFAKQVAGAGIAMN